MNSIIYIINGAMTSVMRTLFWPLQGLDPIWALLLVSVLSGLLMLWVFAKVSDQKAIGEARRRIHGNLLGIRLFQHDVAVVLGLQGRILRNLLSYLRYSMFPIVVLMLPLLLILIQLNLFFSYRPIPAGESTLVKVRMAPDQVMQRDVKLLESEAYAVESPAVRMPGMGEIAWRVRTTEPGRHRVVVQVGDTKIEKDLLVGPHWSAISSLRTGALFDFLFYSGESPMPAQSPLQSIEIRYPSQALTLFGWETHWLVVFLIVSLVAAFVFKGPLGVEM